MNKVYRPFKGRRKLVKLREVAFAGTRWGRKELSSEDNIEIITERIESSLSWQIKDPAAELKQTNKECTNSTATEW